MLDVGLNYYGWNDEKALEYWKQHIKDQDEIALREIGRMKRWPAQIHTYKYGAARILALKEKLKQKLGDKFDVKKFHDSILNCGSVPFDLLGKLVLREN